jgi:hypothetical protein
VRPGKYPPKTLFYPQPTVICYRAEWPR